MILVKNEPPSLENLPYRLAIIGDIPCEDDETVGKPFVGTPGRYLHAIMSQTDLMKSGCFMGNLMQYRPPYGRLDKSVRETDEYKLSIETLTKELRDFKPNLCLLLGDAVLQNAGVSHSVENFRGSLFESRETDSPFYGLKCLSTYHPSKLNKQYDLLPLLAVDLKRARAEAVSNLLELPKRVFDLSLTAAEICERLDSIRSGTRTSIDIEGGVTQGITCVGVSTHRLSAFIVNIKDFATSEQVRILRALGRVLGDPTIPKILQNSLYDNFVLSWNWKMPIRNVRYDTMLSGWELYPELPKGLGTQTSIYTRQPYYKFERKIDDKLTHYGYCCMDAAVTLEIAEEHEKIMTEAQQSHYQFNLQLLPVVLYMELKGMKYDTETAAKRLESTTAKMIELQRRIDLQAKHPLNPNSPKQMVTTIYKELGFPPQYVIDKDTKQKKLSCGLEPLLNLVKTPNPQLILDILHWRTEESQRKQMMISADKDGRIRASYTIPGTETGRLTCSESPTGSGTNLTTIMKKNRDLYVADEGKEFFQCDLAGADGWTVAAHCKRLGDPTLMNDYLAGIKPARVLAVMYLHGSKGYELANISIDKMKEVIGNTEIPEWLYAACKAVQHGSSYGMGKITMSKNILKRSWKDSGKPIYVSPADCEKLQGLYMRGRYQATGMWQRWVKKELESKRTLGSASGHIRTFFGREHDNATLTAALSQEPQANTTYATNLAALRLWTDPENWDENGKLIVEPLHQVHDALCGQWPAEKRDWAIAKIRSWFSNELTIAEQKLIIPFEGAYGENWLGHNKGCDKISDEKMKCSCGAKERTI